MKKWLFFAVMSMVLLLLAGCGSESATNSEDSKVTIADKKVVTIGYFPNVTHAPAMIGLKKGFFQEELGDGVKVETKIFPNGSLFMDALMTGQLDFGYVGPGPSINRFLKGADVKAIAGVSTGGIVFVASKSSGVTSVADLDGKIYSTPAIGCTHDISLQTAMESVGLVNKARGGSVEQRPMAPAEMLGLLQQGQIDVAAVSEPWASQMEQKAGAIVFADWDQVPWGGKLSDTILVTNGNILKDNPELVKSILKGHIKSIDFINNNKVESIQIVQETIKEIAKKELPTDILESSFKRVSYTYDLDSQVLQEFADASKKLGFIKGEANLNGFVDLSLLDSVK
ncbi:aliphatic sulfonate ABC transporter substrate-binding protein [Microaerobacter geothermalis]|uniref:aliphatic sulfonate ABC transporter substrate-binding protein n=1 Tax=Microaerobacter geothermalis TaxID=674972 RepID=UPI001F37F845|nr:aliphatic sulfonate ABC transporter substrate-binding protein [Microaerobacter geothermalis]MCF6093727.1 aliphatic sulfonate ABC transporter substrate-binding protein [Microaerobacter geothermalis]